MPWKGVNASVQICYLQAQSMSHPTQLPDSRSTGHFHVGKMDIITAAASGTSSSFRVAFRSLYLSDSGKMELCELCGTKKKRYLQIAQTTGRNGMDKLQYTCLSWDSKHNWFSKCAFKISPWQMN